MKYAVEDWESPVSDAADVEMVGVCRKSRMREMRTGFFGIICAVKSIRALIGSRETWKISFVRVGKEENAPFSGRVPFRVSYRAFPGPLLKRGRGLRPLSFPAKRTGAKQEKKIGRASCRERV